MAKQALDGKRANMFLMDPSVLVVVGLDTDDGKDHPLWDERIKLPVDPRLVASIAVLGVSDPVLVRKDADAPIVVDGRQRVRAARQVNEGRVENGLEPLLIPVSVQRGSEERAAATAIARNEIRQDDAIEVKVAKCERYLALGGTPEDAAIHFGVTRQTIYNWTKVGSATADVQKAVAAGSMSMTEAVKVASKPRAEQKAVAAKAKAAVESGAPPKKRGRPKGGAPSRKAEVKQLLAALDNAPKGVFLVHPEFERGLRFALDMLSAKEAGVSGLFGKKGSK